MYNVKDVNDVWPYGESLVSSGLMVRDAVNGYGLVTRGFLWQLYDIWIDTTAAANITTTWTPTQYGIWGEYAP